MLTFIVVLLAAGLGLLVALTVTLIRGSVRSTTSAYRAQEVQEAKQKITAIHEQARRAIFDDVSRQANRWR